MALSIRVSFRAAVASLRRRPVEIRSVWWVLPVFGLVALGAGEAGDLFAWSWPALWELAVFPVVLVVYPSLIEEFVFRGLLLPASVDQWSPARQAIAVAANTTAFVMYHPINHWTLSLSDTSLFVKPAFLVIVAALGVSCCWLRIRTRSLWSPIALHWLTVVVWNLCLGRPR